MISSHLIPIEEDKQLADFTDKQLKIFWLPEEVTVEKDIHDIKVNFTEAERHGIITVLKLFSLYETHIGDEYWGGRFKSIFNDFDAHRMASTFSMFELAVHAPFYNKINELLNLNNMEFFISFLENEEFKSRIEHIGKLVNGEDNAMSLAIFAFIEGVVLYSSFAFIKHFQSNGKNKLVNIVRGINFSVRDENLHALASIYCFKKYTKNYSKEQLQEFEVRLKEEVEKIYKNEVDIIHAIFEKGDIEGITKEELISFVESRINEVLIQLGFTPMFKVEKNPVAEWFYEGITTYNFNDFFSGIGNQYQRNWSETEFTWRPLNA